MVFLVVALEKFHCNIITFRKTATCKTGKLHMHVSILFLQFIIFSFSARCKKPDTVRYEQYNHKRTFVKAEEHCVRLGGHLASATNLREREAVYDVCRPFRYN